MSVIAPKYLSIVDVTPIYHAFCLYIEDFYDHSLFDHNPLHLTGNPDADRLQLEFLYTAIIKYMTSAALSCLYATRQLSKPTYFDAIDKDYQYHYQDFIAKHDVFDHYCDTLERSGILHQNKIVCDILVLRDAVAISFTTPHAL